MKDNVHILLNKISFMQLLLNICIGLIFYFSGNTIIFKSFLVAGVITFFYTQILKLSSYYKALILFGFPLRILIVGIPFAILVHKSKCNLIALFLGFVLSQIIYFIFLWLNAKNNCEEVSGR